MITKELLLYPYDTTTNNNGIPPVVLPPLPHINKRKVD